jgi:opacity protein-like surface antigen
MTRVLAIGLFAAVVVTSLPSRAAADVTAFWGASPTPAARSARGLALGLSLIVVGFEFEYANTAEREADLAPSLRTGMINGLVQTPTRTQFYLTAGGGFYRERLGEAAETNFGTNLGGGVKFALAGPLRLRVDYRVFNLRGNPTHRNPQRFYAGVNLTF